MTLHRIPKDWSAHQMSDFGFVNPSQLSEKTEDHFSFFYIDLSMVNKGNLQLPKTRIKFSEAPSRARRLLKNGDVIMSTVRPNLCGHAQIKTEMTDLICSTGFAVIRPKLLEDQPYIYHYLFSDHIHLQIKGLIAGSNYPAVNASDVEQLIIIAPKSPIERSRISNIIDRWERAIDHTKKLIAAKQERRIWLIQQLLTGTRRLPGFKKSNKLRKTPFGNLPADWGYPRMGDVAKEVSERNGDNATRPVLSCTKHQGLVDSLTYFGKRIFSADLSNYKVVHRHQFAYATNHIDEGSIGYQDSYDEALISPIYTVFQTNDTMDDRFLFLILKTETYRHIFASNTSASVDRRGSLRWHDFANIHIPHPSIEEQKAIVKVINTADRELDLLRSQLEALREQKKGLMQQLLTGKVRVNV